MPLARRPITQAVLDEPNARRALALLAEGAADLYQRAGPLIAAYMESAGADPEMRRHADTGASEAAKIMHDVARGLRRRKALRPGLSVGDAGDTLLALCSQQVHHLLRRERGWTTDRYRTWLTSMLERAVLPD